MARLEVGGQRCGRDARLGAYTLDARAGTLRRKREAPHLGAAELCGHAGRSQGVRRQARGVALCLQALVQFHREHAVAEFCLVVPREAGLEPVAACRTRGAMKRVTLFIDEKSHSISGAVPNVTWSRRRHTRGIRIRKGSC